MTETHKSNRPKAPLTRKKKILFVAAVLGVLLVLVFLSTLEIPSPSDTDADETAFTPVTHPPQNFYDPPEGDIFTLPEYLALDRTIEYTFGGESHEISETWLPDSPFDRFFLSYFSALQQGFSGGDTQSGFNAFYSAVYFRRNSPFPAFSPQMVYDIEVERLTDPQTITAADTEEDAAYLGCTLTTFAVRYKIFRNVKETGKMVAIHAENFDIIKLLTACDFCQCARNIHCDGDESIPYRIRAIFT